MYRSLWTRCLTNDQLGTSCYVSIGQLKNKATPNYLCDSITLHKDIANIIARSYDDVNKVHVPWAPIQLFKNAFAYKGPVAWNTLLKAVSLLAVLRNTVTSLFLKTLICNVCNNCELLALAYLWTRTVRNSVLNITLSIAIFIWATGICSNYYVIMLPVFLLYDTLFEPLIFVCVCSNMAMLKNSASERILPCINIF